VAGIPSELPWPGGDLSGLLGQASALLSREALKLPAATLGKLGGHYPAGAPEALAHGAPPAPDLAGHQCPLTGAVVPGAGAEKPDLRRQAHELLAALLPGAAHQPGGAAAHSAGAYPGLPAGLAQHKCPMTGATAPAFPLDRDRLRRQAHEFIETLLITFNEATGEKGLPAEDKVPLLFCAAPVQAGNEARAMLTVVNDETTPSDVTLYSTNFVADSGYEIPALRVNASPRRVSIPAKGQASFEIRIQVPQQAPTGIYSGLIQAMGTKFVKAVLSVQVL
jgi:hypothetical protein